MKTRVLFLLFAFMIILPATTYSQVGGVLRRAVNRQINNEVDSLLDKKIQDEQNANRAKMAQQKAEQEAANAEQEQPDDDTDAKPKTNSNESSAAFGNLFSNKVTLKYRDEYKFDSRLYMVSEVYDKKDVMKIDFYMFYSASNPVIGVETSTIAEEGSTPLLAKMIMDGENKSFLMLSDVNGMKMGMISEIPEGNAQVTGPDGKPIKNYTPPSFTKTGNTRNILGYKCDEYSYSDKELKTSGKVWFTKEVKLKIDKRGWNNSNMSYYYGSPVFNEGIILANESYDDKGKLATKSETKEINENFPHTISAAGYPLRQINMNQK